MRRRSPVFGATLAELAFVLLFATIPMILWQGQKVNSLTQEFEELQEKVSKEGEGKLSDIPPPCPGVLFVARIVGQNEYLIEGKSYTLQGIKTNYHEDRQRARAAQCRYKIVARHRPGLDLEEYLRALKRLETVFYYVDKELE